MDDHTETNRRHWDELVPLHVRSDFYDVSSFKRGRSSLHEVERAELGDVRGKTLLHLQCHFGMDTLSWAREGATVTGVDFSERGIDAARALASELRIAARFVHSDVYSLPDKLDERFDIVYTAYGVLFWLPDLRRWADIVAHFLKPGGAVYVVEFHPIQHIFDTSPDVDDLRINDTYFPSEEPLEFDDDGSYACPDARLVNRVTYSWPHPLSEVVTSLAEAGLRIDFLHEFPFTVEKFFPFMEKTGNGTYRLTKGDGVIPLLYSLKATKE